MIDFYATSNLWLHLEHFTNAGLTRDEMSEAISTIVDFDGMTRLRCQPMHVNSDLIVSTKSTTRTQHEYLVNEIEDVLEELLQRKRKHES